ncbi:acyl-CoA thioesterase/bile acid-CoA:amino acid N-acyltransferase family protein [Variovorax sp. J2P1-59]|uniref:acyl-CoA thioesterase/bile acid-CoA:amino acid N-acyltransferase family protein n=1 Tax=Variovorax flavidus TaxID=3053501 RepID=UPI00257919FB|nr:acyl-CoA thioesterase/bile acid-CoA:amino acid N-acyltransferase family protein [Variovorax sp. J2P1-59]MDM0075207.1 acyl-CoA thioesterase/bile acid-CoA:amino acid N-acyltransferase family protein [Variovorax sp. J2P1-59]
MKFDTLPPTCLVDETLVIRVLDLHAGARITLKLWSSFSDVVLLSSATFIADSNGIVDLGSQAPVSGSYRGVDAMGLFWSRAPVHGDVAKGFEGKSTDPFTATLTAEGEDGAPPISHPIRRVFLGPAAVSRDVKVDGLVGRMFEPAHQGPHRAVLVVGGSNGGLAWSQEMAALLASRGYAALALAYFAAEGLPPTLDRIPLEYFGTALEWMSAQPGVAAKHLAVVGISRGGELALLLGATYPGIRAVVAYVPSGIAWPAYPPTGHGAWTLNGKEVPYADTLSYDASRRSSAGIEAGKFDCYLVPLEDADFADRAAIPVERINGPVLLISGADDQLWPSSELAEFAVRRFTQTGFPHRVEHLKYANAGHSIGWPNGPTTMLKFKHPVSGEDMDMGGTPEGTAHARQDSWSRMLAFLQRALADG